MGEIVDHGDGGGAQLIGDRTQPSAVGNRLMAAAQKCECNVSHIKLRAGPLAERVIREEDTHGGYTTSLECAARPIAFSWFISGSMCSRNRMTEW